MVCRTNARRLIPIPSRPSAARMGSAVLAQPAGNARVEAAKEAKGAECPLASSRTEKQLRAIAERSPELFRELYRCGKRAPTLIRRSKLLLEWGKRAG